MNNRPGLLWHEWTPWNVTLEFLNANLDGILDVALVVSPFIVVWCLFLAWKEMQ